MTNEPFFTVEGTHYVPTPASRGPWNPNSLHGRVIAGLLGAEIERLHGSPDFIPARLTVDMYRLPDLSPVEVTTTVVRAGNRIKVIDAEFISGGVSAGRATCQLLKRTENPTGNVWAPPTWDVPKPEDIPPPDTSARPMGGMWAMRRINGDFGTVGQKRVWMAELRELVAGRALTPFVRVAVSADFASPAAHAGDAGVDQCVGSHPVQIEDVDDHDVPGADAAEQAVDVAVHAGGTRDSRPCTGVTREKC